MKTMIASVCCLFTGMAIFTTAQGVTFTDIAENGGAGINYQHAQTARYDVRKTQFFIPSQQTPMFLRDTRVIMPIHVPGKGGVLLLDYDNDGDIDIFATNVAGRANSLFQNQLSNGGGLHFIDVAEQAGIHSPAHQGSGACYADIDNDGDADIFVVGDDDTHQLYQNNGDGTFSDISLASGGSFTSSTKGGTGCAFGDIDNDGFVDLHVAHAWDFDTGAACFAIPFADNVGNELFRNNGNNTFSDVSASSGIQQLGVLPPGAQAITWATAMVDYDQDGDIDLFNGDDNCGLPPAAMGGVDRGLIQIWDNDGSGNFSNVTVAAGTNKPAQWMGLDFADFNHDGNLDFFATSMGDYMFPALGAPIPLGASTSRMFTGNGDGTFSDPGIGGLLASPFGWGVSAEDFDNDGDTDVIYSGGIDLAGIITNDNPGTVLLNDGAGNYTFDSAALGGRGTRQNVQGVATGDLDGDGLVDIVTVANFDIPDYFPLVISPAQFGGPFDATAFFVPAMNMVGPGLFSWSGLEYVPGSMRVEINQSVTAYESVSIEVVGSVGLVAGGSVNRDGIGAIVSFTPEHGNTAMKPVTGGASHVAQNTHALNFGLGDAHHGMLDVLWPGGVRNRLYGIHSGAAVVMPEIPCSIDTEDTIGVYRHCVKRALHGLVKADVVSKREGKRLFKSAMRAYRKERN